MGTVCVKGEKLDKNQPISEVVSKKVQGIEILIQKGEIVDLKVDAIVNPCDQKSANQLVKSAGSKIEQEISKFSEIPKGQAFITEAGNLQAKLLIHVNLLPWQGSEEDKEVEKIKESIDSILKAALDNKIVSIGFPDMFSGPFVAPIQLGAKTLLDKLIQFCNEKPKDTHFERFHIISQDQNKLKVYCNELEKLTLDLVNKPDEEKQKEGQEAAKQPQEEVKQVEPQQQEEIKQEEAHHHDEEKPKQAHLLSQEAPQRIEEPPKEPQHIEEPPKEELPNQEQPHQEPAQQEQPHQEPPHQEPAQQEQPQQEQPQQEQPQQEQPQQEQPHHEEPHHEEPHHEEPPKEEPHHEEPPKEEQHHEEPPKEEVHHEEAPKEEQHHEHEEGHKEEHHHEEEGKKEENTEVLEKKKSYDEIKNEEKQEVNNENGKDAEVVVNEQKPEGENQE